MSSIKSTLPSFAADPRSTLYKIRRDRKISVEELSRLSGVDRQLIRRCERNAELPCDDDLIALANALKCKTGALLGKHNTIIIPSTPNPAPPEFIEHTRRIQELFNGGRQHG